jgi:hypothetical protein
MMDKKKSPKLTDTERHKRFVDTAKKVEASEEISDFDNAFTKIVKQRKEASAHPKRV